MSRKKRSRKRGGAQKKALAPPLRSVDDATVSETPLRLRGESLHAPLLLVWAFLLGCTPLMNFDIWWHLRTGEWILESGRVPLTDLYTYTDLDRPWTNLHWGFQLLAIGLFSLGEKTIGGVELLVLAKAFCLAVTVAVGWRAAGRHVPVWGKTLCWILPVICISGRALVRPEMLSMIFLALWLWIILRVEERPRLIWGLPLLQLIWVNIHALFVLGLVVGAAYLADRLARSLWGGRFGLEPSPQVPEKMHLFRAGVLTAGACIINPYFEEGAQFPLVLYRKFSVDQELYSGVGEFQTLGMFYRKAGLTNLYFDAEILLWLATAVSFLLLWWKGKFSLLRLLLFAAFSHLAWKASRNTNIFSLVSGVLLCANLFDYLALRKTAAGEQAQQKAFRALHRWGAVFTGVLLGGLVISIFTGHWAAWGRENKTLGLGEREAWYPHDAVRFAAQPGMPRRAFLSHNGLAAVYIYHNAPERLVFMDGRLEVASPETYRRYAEIRRRMARMDLSWEALVRDEAGRLPVVILDSRHSRQEINSCLVHPGWRLVFADASAAVFVEQAVAERFQFPEADPAPLTNPPGTTISGFAPYGSMRPPDGGK